MEQKMEVVVCLIFSSCFVFLQMFDLSASLHSYNRTDPSSTATSVIRGLSPEHESTRNTVFPERVEPKMTPAYTSGSVPPSPACSYSSPHFHVGSFLGGMMLAFVITLAATLGYRLACSNQAVRYRAIPGYGNPHATLTSNAASGSLIYASNAHVQLSKKGRSNEEHDAVI